MEATAMALRASVNDFVRDVGARSVQGGPGVPAAIFVGTVNSDGTVTVTRNGATIWKVFWPGSGSAAGTDAAGPGNQDTVNVYSTDGTWAASSTQVFINNLK
jgi:hypothetical protein